MRIRLTFLFLLFSSFALAQPSPITGPGGTQDVNLTQVGGTSTSLGQKTSANSIPVVLPSDQVVNIIVTSTITPDTELSAAATLADNTTNPSTTSVGTFSHWFDGSTWDRAPGTSIDGLLVNLGANNDVTVTGSVTANAGTNLNTSALCLEAGNLATLAAKDFSTQTTLAAMNAKFVTGTDIGDVTINNASGASAVNIQDGGNTITVDGSGTAGTPAGGVLTVQGVTSMTALKVDGSAVTQPISGTVTVTQATGTNLHAVLDTTSTTAATQATPTNLKTQIFGDDTTQAIDTDTSGQLQIDVLTLPSVTVGTFPDNEPFNMAQIAGTATAVNAGVLSAGVQRMTIATDDEINNLLGTIDIDTGNMDTSLNNIETAVQIMDDWDNAASDGASVSGDTAHDAADAGEPVKIGGKAIDYEPDTSDVYNGGLTNVAEGDRTNLVTNLSGQVPEAVVSYFFTLDNISTTYDDNPTTATSTAKEVWQFRKCTFSYDATYANSPTNITFVAQVSLNNGSTFADYDIDYWGDLTESTATITATGIKKALTFPIAWHSMKIKATATGTTASNTITIANAVLYCRN